MKRKLTLWSPLMTCILIVFAGCNKSNHGSNGTNPPNPSPCQLTGDSWSEVGNPQTFTYDNNGLLIQRQFSMGAYYTDFIQKFTATTSRGTYTIRSSGDTMASNVTFAFRDNGNSVYDGMPKSDGRTNFDIPANGGAPSVTSNADTAHLYVYDAKKRLISINMPRSFDPNNHLNQLMSVTDSLIYDDKDNVIQILIINNFAAYVDHPQDPSLNYWAYTPNKRETIDISYDNNPCPYTCMLKYWKFLQGDFGEFTNSDWKRIITGLSTNNAIKIHEYGSDYAGNTVDDTHEYTYNYNEKGFPLTRLVGQYSVETFTYTCK